MDATKLERLLIGEVSGVDDPANQMPGWMILKARHWKAEAQARQNFNRRLDAVLAGAAPPPAPAERVPKAAPRRITSEAEVVEFLEVVDGILLKHGMDDLGREFIARVVILKHLDLLGLV